MLNCTTPKQFHFEKEHVWYTDLTVLTTYIIVYYVSMGLKFIELILAVMRNGVEFHGIVGEWCTIAWNCSRIHTLHVVIEMEHENGIGISLN